MNFGVFTDWGSGSRIAVNIDKVVTIEEIRGGESGTMLTLSDKTYVASSPRHEGYYTIRVQEDFDAVLSQLNACD